MEEGEKKKPKKKLEEGNEAEIKKWREGYKFAKLLQLFLDTNCYSIINGNL